MNHEPEPHRPTASTPGVPAATRSSHSAMLRNALLWSAVATVVIGVAGSLIGFAVAGAEGVYSALWGVLLAALFLGLTAVIMLFAVRFQQPENLTVYFGVVIGGWALKLVIFLIAVILLRGQDWINGYVFFFSVLASVISSLVIDMVVLAKTRVTYASHVGPRQPQASGPREAPAQGEAL